VDDVEVGGGILLDQDTNEHGPVCCGIVDAKVM